MNTPKQIAYVNNLIANEIQWYQTPRFIDGGTFIGMAGFVKIEREYKRRTDRETTFNGQKAATSIIDYLHALDPNQTTVDFMKNGDWMRAWADQHSAAEFLTSGFLE